jgi:hypothetical protein
MNIGRLRTLASKFWLLLIAAWLFVPTQTRAEDGFAPTPIYVIQGNGTATTMADRWVDVVGVVTGVTSTGFYLQDPTGDGDPATSDGIFVYTYDPPTVTAGQCVRVQRALVSEFYGKTELSRLKSVAPDDACTWKSVAPVRIPLSYYGALPAELFERYEGMVVEVVNLHGLVQGPIKWLRDGRAELALLPSALAPYLPAQRVFQSEAAWSAALVHLSNALGAALPQAAWGDQLVIGAPEQGELVARAVVDFNFDKYQLVLLPETPVTIEHRPKAEEQGVAPETDEFTLCSLNLYGFGRGKAQIIDEVGYRAHARQHALVISERLHGCTVIGLQETGTAQDAGFLANELGEVFASPYQATALPGPQSQNLDFPLTNSLLTRSDRVEVLAASAPQACSQQDYAVPSPPGECPDGFFALFDRPPLVADLAVSGEWGEPYLLRVIVNHLKSKAGDERVNSVRRNHQATFLTMLAQQALDANPQAHVAVLGDLNDYYGSQPVETIRNGVRPPLIHTFDYLPALDRYTYIFNGASQVLDHILLSANMGPALASVDILHINTDFPYPVQTDFTQVHHASDHEPLQLRIRPGGAAMAGGNLRYAGLRVTLLDLRQQPLGVAFTDARGDFRFWTLRPGIVTLRVEPLDFVALSPQEMTFTLQPGYNAISTPATTHQAMVLGGAAAWISGNLVKQMSDGR